jgi:hypothetical protein
MDITGDDQWTDADAEADFEMSVRAKNKPALLMAIGMYATEARIMPLWLAEAVCSPWGQSVITDMLKEAEAVKNATPQGLGELLN